MRFPLAAHRGWTARGMCGGSRSSSSDGSHGGQTRVVAVKMERSGGNVNLYAFEIEAEGHRWDLHM